MSESGFLSLITVIRGLRKEVRKFLVVLHLLGAIVPVGAGFSVGFFDFGHLMARIHDNLNKFQKFDISERM